METSSNSFPMRINKYLAWKQLATRRGADQLITDKVVFINGAAATLGAKVNEKDIVEVRRKTPMDYVYLAYNKPVGTVTHSPSEGQVDIKTNVDKLTVANKIQSDVFPLGRLDKDSHGLIILTNDGRITDRLLNPKYEHEKEYVVRSKNKLRSSFKTKMEAGVNIEGYKTEPCKVTILNDNTFKVVLHEGKKHQIRRMCSALFQEVADLKRTRVMNIELGKLGTNSVRKITGKELSTFLGLVLK